MSELKNIKGLPSSLLDMDGLKIYTNLDIGIQKELEHNIDNEMKDTTLQVASVVIEPNTGKNSISYRWKKTIQKSQFNRVTSSKRQVGSTIKTTSLLFSS
ncbi:MAG: hypothetical protein L6V81_07720 [Clostridium sp.]|nr:MAG: hypothetical protein L6V81_07720 [Clostridium sp.]